MPRATLGTSLVDKLVPAVDKIRTALYAKTGVRQYEVHLVKRRWSGAERDDGTVTVLSDVTLTPTPSLSYPNNQGALHDELPAHGRDEEGAVELSEVSLTYTEAELTGGVLAANEEFFYRVVDGQGQAIRTRYYILSAPPQPDREKTIGWKLQLRRVQVEE